MADLLPPPPLLAQYTRGVKLGAGISAAGGGGVWRERHKETGEEVAIKYMKLDAPVTAGEFKKVERELRNAQSAVGVPGVVRFRHARYVPGWVAIVMDLCEGPPLLTWTNELWARPGASLRHVGQKAKRDEGLIEESLIRGVMVQLLKAVAALHASGTGHRDIKLDNVCLTAPLCDFNSAPAVKLIDLGLSKSTTTQSAAGTLLGTAYYIAPEVYAAGRALSKGVKETYDPFKADTWALGVMLLVMLFVKYPLRRRTPDGKDQPIATKFLMDVGKAMAARGELHGKLLEDLSMTYTSDAGRDFILRCFTLDPAQRPTPAELLQDPWVTAGEPYPQLPQAAAPPPGQTQSLEELNALIEVMRKELVRN